MSLRLRLLLAAGLVALVGLVAADAVTYSSLGSYLNGQIDSSLDQAHPNVEACLNAGVEPNAFLVADNAPGMFLEERTRTGAVVGYVRARSFSEGGAVLPGPKLPARMPGLRGRSVRLAGEHHLDGDEECGSQPSLGRSGGGSGSGPGATGAGLSPEANSASLVRSAPTLYFTSPASTAGGPAYRVRASLLANGGIMFLALPLTSTDSTLHRLLLTEIAVTAAALIVALMLGWWLIRLSMRPLVEVEETAAAIGEGDLAARVPEPRRPSTEIGRLARVLNSMLGRIESAFRERDRTEEELRRSEERMRRFLADASHELRTPLSAVSAYSELFERGAEEHPEDLPRVLRGIRQETTRMGHLVNDLLLLANLDEGRPVEQESVELVLLAIGAIETHRAVGPEWPVTLMASEPVEVIGDAVRLRQVLDNLLANVRAYTPPGTATDVAVGRTGEGGAEILIADHGPGLGEQGLRRAFERFYRTEESRARARGGAGLGLAIVRAIVQAHGGSVAATETAGGGATFRVVLPAAPTDEDAGDGAE